MIPHSSKELGKSVRIPLSIEITPSEPHRSNHFILSVTYDHFKGKYNQKHPEYRQVGLARIRCEGARPPLPTHPRLHREPPNSGRSTSGTSSAHPWPAQEHPPLPQRQFSQPPPPHPTHGHRSPRHRRRRRPHPPCVGYPGRSTSVDPPPRASASATAASISSRSRAYTIRTRSPQVR